MKQPKHNKSTVPGNAFFQQLTTIYIASIVSFFILFAVGGYEMITFYKAMCFFTLTGGYVVILSLSGIELALSGCNPFAPLRTTWSTLHISQKLIFIYWILTAISTMLSVDIKTSFSGSGRFDGFITTTLYCLVFFLISSRYKPQKSLIWMFGTAITISCIISIIQFFGKNPLALFPEGMNYYDAYKLYSGQFSGTIGNVDIYSAVLCIAIPIFWISIIKLKGSARFLLAIPLVLCIITLGKIFVAGGIIGILVGTMFTFPFLTKNKKTKYILLGIVIFIFVILIIIVYCFGAHWGGFVKEASELLHGNWDDSFGSGRLYIWRKAAELIPERLLFGGGPDTFGLRTDAKFERIHETTGMLIKSGVDVAHNEYLNILVNQGILALIAYLGALFFAIRKFTQNASQNAATAICGGALICYSVQAFFGISSPAAAPLFWICLAIVVNNNQNKQKQS